VLHIRQIHRPGPGARRGVLVPLVATRSTPGGSHGHPA
jgi:hypothetical protein